MLAVVKNPGEVRARTGFLHRTESDQSQLLYRLGHPHLRASSNSKIVQFRIRVYCSQINHAFVSKAAMSSDCTLHPCGLWRRLAKKENKHRWSPQHVQLLWRDWARQSSQVQDQSICICMVNIFAGGTNTRVRTPRKGAPWCSFSRMVHKFAREFVRRCTFTRGGGGGDEYAVTPAWWFVAVGFKDINCPGIIVFSSALFFLRSFTSILLPFSFSWN